MEPIRRKILRKERKEKGLCVCCGNYPPEGFSTCDKWRSYQQSWRERNREKIRTRNAEKRKIFQKEINTNHKAWRDKLKREVVDHYGGKCACCKEEEITFLTLDHINNDGAAHRIKLFGKRVVGGQRFYSWLKKNDYPADIQVLCFNCNIGKNFLGFCPHTLEKK